MVNEDAALLNRHVTQVTPPHFSAAVYTWVMALVRLPQSTRLRDEYM